MSARVSVVGVERLDWAEVRARRLARHGLTGRGFGSLVAAATAIGGAHAQVMSAAELSLALRTPGTTAADVRSALWERHELVKTYGPRGTVHLLATADLPLWCGALAAVPPASTQPPAMSLTADQTTEVVAAIASVLADADQPLTTDELGAAVTARTGPWAGDLVIPAFSGAWPRWRRALDPAAHRGGLVFGSPRGRSVTYASPDAWLPGFAPANTEPALQWLLRGYLHAYGPARPRDYARWLATSPGWAADQFGAAADLVEVELAGEPAWMLADDRDAPAPEPGAGLRLLPYFDNYVVAGQPRELLFPGRAAERALSRTGQAGNYPVLLRDGEVAGVWHRKAAGRRATLTVEPLAGFGRGDRAALADQADRIGEITGTATTLVVGPVAVGPHA